ncbi:LYR motif-containing protein 1-like [Ruditapes philippinarum]|uniref:LYR motif-containing protein 1-like n=1 Tax=Ruditapes philippinarum TaxID=129788 RepID=UPI00295AF777|nr:LYR motif-containing protein 1-like [Ruditapes philippinarum]XP_060601935.1 LYR motif-containing protein 1-like [Ruditapes philippinarum]XP_060601936.1 LYR motif-containing protein 1-like [Ruditapes philippinarum]
MSLRNEVLSLYRKLIRLSYKWESSLGNPGSDGKERIYIRDEARRLFKRNKSITDVEEIKQHLKEGQTRLELALHYKTPYPRPVHLPQHVLHSPKDKRLKAQKRKLEQSKPIYIKSYTDES